MANRHTFSRADQIKGGQSSRRKTVPLKIKDLITQRQANDLMIKAKELALSGDTDMIKMLLLMRRTEAPTNKGVTFDVEGFTPKQIETVRQLIKDVCESGGINPPNWIDKTM